MVELTPSFDDALAYAVQLHRSQRRKGTEIPYVAHLLAVCSLALEYGATETEAIAALLHDAIEDQGGNAVRQQIRQRFGDDVAAIVDGCTDAETIPKPPWRARKEHYITHLRDAEPSVRLISACDKLHNLRCIVADYRSLGEGLWQRFNGGKEGTLWYYQQLAAVLRSRGPRAVSDEIDRLLAVLGTLVADES